jgi:hypothetical protein
MAILKERREHYRIDVVHWSLPERRSKGRPAYKRQTHTRSNMEDRGFEEQITVKMKTAKPGRDKAKK